MTFRATGFIIGKRDFRESDRMFTLYTREYGKIQAMGQATRKLESKLSGNLELLNHATFTIAKGKAVDRIATVDIKHSFECLKENLEKLVVALHCIEVFDQLVKWDQQDPALYGLLETLLPALLAGEDAKKISLGHEFLLQLSRILGYSGESTADTQDAVEEFLLEHSDRPLRSQEYFNFLAGKVKVI